MAVSLQVGVKQTQKLVMTRSLLQGIELLQLTTVELNEKIQSELLENPVLEEDDFALKSTDEPGTELASKIDQSLSGEEGAIPAYDEIYGAVSDVSDTGTINSEDARRRRDYLESCITTRESLSEHLLWQARMTAENSGEYFIYERIITALDGNGFLSEDISVICDGVETRAINRALRAIREFDPVGCAVGSVKESLLIQARFFYPDDTILHRVISDHIEQVEKLDFASIARDCGISVRHVIEKNRIIQGLDPFPGRKYSTEATSYIFPDIEVFVHDDRIFVTQRDEWLPRVRISSYYADLARKKNIEKKARGYIQDKIQSARYLLQNIASRRETIQRVVEAVMGRQDDFLRKGPGNLKPLTHQDISREVGMSESTVSRATSGKYVQTPWGVFDLKYFFVSRLRSSDRSRDRSSDQVMAVIRHLVEHENPEAPLSDEEIAGYLEKNGVSVARRTVAKYRGIMNIPPLHRRKKLNLMNKEEQT